MKTTSIVEKTSATVQLFCNGQIVLTSRRIENFWKRVKKEGPLPDQTNEHYKGLNRCWLWTGYKDRDGYANTTVGNKTIGAYRLMWILHHGDIPLGMQVMHLCDEKTCVNIEHLKLGTNADNVADMVRKGRQAIGDANGARLHPERKPRGENHWMRRMPEKIRRGERHWTRLRSGKIAQ